MRIVFATSNPHKIDEVRAILAPEGVEVLGLDDVTDDPPPPPVEDGTTFAENARIKAVAYAAALGMPCLADDSGLCVDALAGAPGVHSARYAGEGDDRPSRDAANNAKLLRELEGIPEEDRTARFVCSMCLAAPDGRIIAAADGAFEGRIVDEPRGEHGFGYDPLLLVEDAGCTAAELDPAEKNRRSHRGEAARQLAAKLREG